MPAAERVDQPSAGPNGERKLGDAFGGAAYREKVFAYIEKEDTPASLIQQLDWLRVAGFSRVEVLHKNSCFAAFGAVKAS